MSDLIELVVTNGKPTTTSLQIAEHFGKRHDNVLRDIERLECPEDFNRLNFEEVTHKYVNGKGGVQTGKAYNITKDGFMFLAMGFTGKEAAAWKVRFIEAFNAMERQLLENMAAQQVPRPGAPQTLSHRADNLVAASRTFNAMVRSSTAARIPLPAALRRAAEITLRETGINMLDELQADEHLANLESARAAKAKPMPVGAPSHVVEFLSDLQQGALGDVGSAPLLSSQMYRLYLIWCRTSGVVAYPVRMAAVVGPALASGQFTRFLKRYIDSAGATTHPHSFLYPAGVVRPSNCYEPEWLGDCAQLAEAAIKELEQ